MPPNPVSENFTSWQPDATTADSNNPIAASAFMNVGSANDLSGELRLFKSTFRQVKTDLEWNIWQGINAPYSPSPNAPVFVSATQFSLTGDWTSASVGFYPSIAIIGRRTRAHCTAGLIYGTITGATFGGGITTVTVVNDSGALDAGLSQVDFGSLTPGRGALPGTVLTQVTTPLYSVITNGGAGSAFTGTLNPPITAYAQGQTYTLKWTQASQGNDTVALNALTAITIKKNVAGTLVNLAAGDIPAGAVADFIYDSAGPTLQMIGGPVPSQLVTIYDRSVGNPAVDVVNTALETSIYSKSVAGNTIGIDGALRITVEGDLLNNTGASATLEVKVKFGGTTVLDTGAISYGDGSTNRIPLTLQVLIGNLGTTNAQRVRGLMQAYGTASGITNGTMLLTSVYTLIGQYTGLALDTTVAQTLQVTVTLGSANANLEFRSFQVYVEQIPA